MNRQQLLNQYLRGANILTEQVKLLPPALLDYRPAIADAWTIREHVAHLAASETEQFIRLNPAITQAAIQAGPIGSDVDPDDAEADGDPGDPALATLMAVRELVFDYLSDDAPAKWSMEYTVGLGEGKTIQLKAPEFLEIYIAHLAAHQDFIERNIADFGALDGSETTIDLDDPEADDEDEDGKDGD